AAYQGARWVISSHAAIASAQASAISSHSASPSAKASVTSTALRLRSSVRKCQICRQQEQANNRNLRSLAVLPRKSSIRFGSVQVSHFFSVTIFSLSSQLLALRYFFNEYRKNFRLSTSSTTVTTTVKQITFGSNTRTIALAGTWTTSM